MPIILTSLANYSRRQLRQDLGRDYLHDTIVSTTTGSWGTQVGSITILDSAQADPTASGESLYQRAYMRLMGSAGVIQDLRVGSFNTGSGAYLSALTLATTLFSGMPYEVSTLISPSDRDRALDEVIRDVRVRQELPIWSIPNGNFYSIGPDVDDILDVRYLAQPTNSLNYDERQVDWWKLESTGSGVQLRIRPSLQASQMLIIDAVAAVSLGAGDLSTVALPNEDWILYGAAAKCYHMMESQSPGKETSVYAARRREMAVTYTRLSQRFQPNISRRIQLDLPW